MKDKETFCRLCYVLISPIPHFFMHKTYYSFIFGVPEKSYLI